MKNTQTTEQTVLEVQEEKAVQPDSKLIVNVFKPVADLTKEEILKFPKAIMHFEKKEYKNGDKNYTAVLLVEDRLSLKANNLEEALFNKVLLSFNLSSRLEVLKLSARIRFVSGKTICKKGKNKGNVIDYNYVQAIVQTRPTIIAKTFPLSSDEMDVLKMLNDRKALYSRGYQESKITKYDPFEVDWIVNDKIEEDLSDDLVKYSESDLF